MPSLYKLLSISFMLAMTAVAQQAVPNAVPQDRSGPQPDGHLQTEVLQVKTQLVVVDVVVRDHEGHPVRGLKREDFTLAEDKKPQVLRNFDEHSTLDASANRGLELPKLPPGTFTDYTPVPENGTLNILLLDSLNTPLSDQAYVRSQLAEYVRKADPGTRIAIFGLNSRLTLLQGFTARPEVLKDAVEHKLIAHGSDLLDDPAGTQTDQTKLSDALNDAAPPGGGGADFAETVANVQQFETQTQSFQLQLRLQYTLDAFNQLAHYLSAFPGRKNLIWFSGSFPLDILPDDTVANPFASIASSEAEFRETSNLLTKAQIAVYPVDARGLMNNPVYNAAQSGHSISGNPGNFTKQISGFSASQSAEHTTMDQIAEQTGGQAFYNTNGLADAVASAVTAGSNYYTLTYSPTDHRSDGAYRSISVALVAAQAARGFKISYRHGYFASESGKPQQASATGATANVPGQAGPATGTYARTVLSRGAPEPTDIVFTARVLPSSMTTVEAVAPGNQLSSDSSVKGPFRNYGVDLAAFPKSFMLTLQDSGNRVGDIEFNVYVYSADGKLLNSNGRTVRLTVPPKNYTTFMQNALGMHLEVSVPVRTNAYMRVIIHDVPGDLYGAIEIPVSSVSRLSPLPPAPSAQSPHSAPSAAPPQH